MSRRCVVVVLSAFIAGSGVVGTAEAQAAESPVTVSVGHLPAAIAVDPGTGTAYVIGRGNGRAEHGNGTLSIVHGTDVTTMPVGGTPVSVTVDPATHTAYVGVFNTSSSVLVVSPTNKRRIPVSNPIDVAVDSSDGTVWVLEAPRLLVAVHGKSRTTYGVEGDLPIHLALDGVRHVPYVLSPDGTLTSVSGGKVFVKQLGGGAAAVTVDPSTGVVYVAHSSYFAGGVLHPALLSQLSGFQLRVVDLGYVSVGGLAVDSSSATVAVSEYSVNDRAFGRVALVHGLHARQLVVGGTPGAVAAAGGTVCVANGWDSTASIVQGTTVTNVPTGTDPTAAAIDGTAHLCYVAGFGDDTLTELPLT